jgi:hypothetical protein
MRLLLVGCLVAGSLIGATVHEDTQHHIFKRRCKIAALGVLSGAALFCGKEAFLYCFYRKVYQRGLRFAYQCETTNIFQAIKGKYFDEVPALIRCESRADGLYVTCKSEFTDDEVRIKHLADDLAAFNYYQRSHHRPIWRFKYEQGTGYQGHYNRLWFLIPAPQ